MLFRLVSVANILSVTLATLTRRTPCSQARQAMRYMLFLGTGLPDHHKLTKIVSEKL